MKTTRTWLAIAAGLTAIPAAIAAPAIPSFPGAEGYGGLTPGGRGGAVKFVTNLDDSGPGSLREAVEAKGPRIVVFRVGGAIALKKPLSINEPFITIAGQTAPGDGICLRGQPLGISTNDVIVRYLRVRLGGQSGGDDAVSSRFQKNVILDHLSASWSVDETMSVYHCENVTVQWCLVSESLYQSSHKKGHHGFGGIWGSNNSTYHHNLLAHHSSRNPRFASSSGFTDFRNNVIYNWGYNSSYGGEMMQKGRVNFSTINMVANYYKPGPATSGGSVSHRIANPSTRKAEQDLGKWYVSGNFMEGDPKVSADNWDGGVQADLTPELLAKARLTEPWPSMPIRPQTAEQAYESVLKHAGASLPKRDAIDARIIGETRAGTATFGGSAYTPKKKQASSGKTGIIDSENDVGGWVEMKGGDPPADRDLDGMPDAWESRHGLDPDKPDGTGDKDNDGYTNVEEYLNDTDPTVFIDYTKPENNVFSFDLAGAGKL